MDLGKYAKDLQGLLDLMKRNDLAEIEIEGEGHKIRLRKTEPKISAAPIAFTGEPLGMSAVGASAAAQDASGSAEDASETDDSHRVTSPLVGTFYRAPSPEAEPFVQEGDRVEADTVLCIIEAMKVLNEITAGVDGVVREIVVGNGEPVEFGETLYRIDTE
jgi:acetyl-CoA carboxylase biotin carboxyl carrier protein